MEFIKTSHYGTPLDVLFCGQYYMLDSFHGLVGFVDFPEVSEDGDVLTYKIEYTSVIDKTTIERIIKKTRNDMHKKFGTLEQYQLKFDYTLHMSISSLPYYLDIKLRPMNL